MDKCMFSGHCIKITCDKSCPAFVESSFLLEQNGININSQVFSTDPKVLAKYSKIVENAEGKVQTVIAKNTNAIAECINNKLKTILKSAYRYHNFERFRKRALLICTYTRFR